MYVFSAQQQFGGTSAEIIGGKDGGLQEFEFHLKFTDIEDIAGFEHRLNEIRKGFKKSRNKYLRMILQPIDEGSVYGAGIEIKLVSKPRIEGWWKAQNSFDNFLTTEVGSVINAYLPEATFNDIRDFLLEAELEWNYSEREEINPIEKITEAVAEAFGAESFVAPLEDLGKSPRFMSTIRDISSRTEFDPKRIQYLPLYDEFQLFLKSAKFNQEFGNLEEALVDYDNATFIIDFIFRNHPEDEMRDELTQHRLLVEFLRLGARVKACELQVAFDNANAYAFITERFLKSYIAEHCKPKSMSLYNVPYNVSSDFGDYTEVEVTKEMIEAMEHNMAQHRLITKYLAMKGLISKEIDEVMASELREGVFLTLTDIDKLKYLTFEEKGFFLGQLLENEQMAALAGGIHRIEQRLDEISQAIAERKTQGGLKIVTRE